MSEELYNTMKEQGLEACLDISEQDSTTYDNERTLTFISILMYQVHTQDPTLFCVDTGAPISCIGNQILTGIFQLADRNSTPIIESERDLQFGNTLIRSKGTI